MDIFYAVKICMNLLNVMNSSQMIGKMMNRTH